MMTLSGIKLKIMVRAFRIRIKNGEAFEDIAADYPALTTDDLEAIKEALNTNQPEQPSGRLGGTYGNQSKTVRSYFIAQNKKERQTQ